MKTIFKMNLAITMCCLTAFIFSSCNEENVQEQEQPVQFSFSTEVLSEQGKIADADVRAIVISVKDASGKHVFEMKKVALYKAEGSFISEPISLKPGDYKLTHFMAVDEDNNVIYISPKEGSEKAYLVNDPLPVLFSVMENKTSDVPVAVIRVEADPEAYGYVSYTLHVQNTVKFRVQAFEFDIPGFAQYEEPVFKLTDAHIEVYLQSPDEVNKIFEGTITPTNDLFEIKDYSSTPIHIKVTKPNYHPYGKTFTRAELEALFDDPLEVVLEKEEPFKLVIKSQNGIGAVLVPSGAPNKLLYTTNEGLFKIDVSDLENPGDPVLLIDQPLQGSLIEDLHGNLFINNYMSSDQGETWQMRTVPEDEPQHNFVDLNGIHYGLRGNNKLYRETSIGQWEFVRDLPYGGDLIVYDDKLFAANGLLVSTDGENFTETGIDTEYLGELYDVTGIFTAMDNLYMNYQYGSDQGFFLRWTGNGWNTVYEYDAEFELSEILAGGYENYMVLVELNSLKIFKNCCEDDCEPIYSYFFRWDPDQMPPATITGRLLSGEQVYIQGSDDNGYTYLWGADLSTLDL